jgi:ECF transporter S component (folate family)
MKKLLTTRTIALMGILIAFDIVLTRVLSIDTQFLRMSANFITHTVIGALFGPALGGIALGIADLVGFFLKPTGPFFPGITLAAVLVGVLYGFFYYKKPITLTRTIIATIVIVVLDSLVIMPLVLAWGYHVPIWTLMPMRIVRAVIQIPIQVIVTYFVLPQIVKIPVFSRFQKTQLNN